MNRVQVFRSQNPDVINDLSTLTDMGADQVAQSRGATITGSQL